MPKDALHRDVLMHKLLRIERLRVTAHPRVMFNCLLGFTAAVIDGPKRHDGPWFISNEDDMLTKQWTAVVLRLSHAWCFVLKHPSHMLGITMGTFGTRADTLRVRACGSCVFALHFSFTPSYRI